ncbi:rCG64240 [Rattus norvegicus]|uniref:RCG64240 n=1 Tax=Rattus norvegicus TaxID=10116 RepID=A6K1Z8_RAT|nr:rCG64240 [Rattus norvegicus]
MCEMFGKSVCRYRAEPLFPESCDLRMALSRMTLGFSEFTLAVLGVFVKYHSTPIVKANNWALAYILLLTLTFCFLCSLLFIGQPNTVTCILQQNVFMTLFTVVLSTVSAKTLTVVPAFKAIVPQRIMRWLMLSRALTSSSPSVPSSNLGSVKFR